VREGSFTACFVPTCAAPGARDGVRARAGACGPSLALGSGQEPGHPVYRLRLAEALPTRCRVTVECEHAVVVIARKALLERRQPKRRHPRPLGPGCTSASVCVLACVCAAGCAPACAFVGTRLCRCRPNPIAKQKIRFAIISKQEIPSHNRMRSYKTRQTRCEPGANARACAGGPSLAPYAEPDGILPQFVGLVLAGAHRDQITVAKQCVRLGEETLALCVSRGCRRRVCAGRRRSGRRRFAPGRARPTAPERTHPRR